MTLNIQEIEERCSKATPGPWQPLYAHTGRGTLRCIDDVHGNAIFDPQGLESVTWIDATRDDVSFACHARTDIPALLEDRKRLVEALTRCRDRFFPADQSERDKDIDWDLVNSALAGETK